MESVTKVRIDLKARIVELEGPEDFVSTQLEWIRDLMLSSPAQDPESPGEPGPTPEATMKADSLKPDNHAALSPDRYQSVFGVPKELVDSVIHTEDSAFRIIAKKISGNTKEQQTKLALLHCLASELYGFETTATELRELCKTYACYDVKNFAANMKDQTNWFILDGKKGSQSWRVKLTVPGRKAAQEALASLCKE